jgi:predicted esterase
MYNNCKVINASNKHEFTFILLHPMHCNGDYFNSLVVNFEKNNFSNYIFESIKFIMVNADKIDIDYPNNKLYNISSWYNYYTCNDGIDKIDKINTEQYYMQSNRILNIINNEAFILNNYNRIFLVGVSQGGTLLFDILNNIPRNIGGIFAIKTIYMYKYTKLTNKFINTPIYIFSGNNDDIYTIKFQKKCYRKIINKKYRTKWLIKENLDHNTKSLDEDNFIINNFINKINNSEYELFFD